MASFLRVLRLLVVGLLLAAVVRAEELPLEEEPEGPPPVSDITEGPLRSPVPSPEAWGPLALLDREVEPGEKRRLFLRASESFAGAAVDLPVLVIRGRAPGPTVCLTAGIHGDELNGIEIVRQYFEEATPKALSGTLMGVPVVNLHGFRRSSRYLPDRRDLNRFFPGHAEGSSASRIANAVFEAVVRRCDALLDFHTGSFHRTNLPQIRANLRIPAILSLARAFGSGVVVHSEGAPGTLRRAANDAGVPAITYEAGEPMRFQPAEIQRGIDGVANLLSEMGMLQRARPAEDGQLVYFRSRWVRVNDGGIFITRRRLGERVASGDLLATVTDPVSNERTRLDAPFSGTIIGMALSQVVIPGFAAFHLGIDSDPTADVAAAPLPEPGITPDQLDVEENPE